MFLTLIHILAVFFMLVGLASLIMGIGYGAHSVGRDGRYIFVMLNDDGADIKLRSTLEYYNLYGADTFEGIIAVDFGLSEKIRTACSIIANESNAIEFYSKDGFKNFLGGEQSENGQ